MPYAYNATEFVLCPESLPCYTSSPLAKSIIGTYEIYGNHTTDRLTTYQSVASVLYNCLVEECIQALSLCSINHPVIGNYLTPLLTAERTTLCATNIPRNSSSIYDPAQWYCYTIGFTERCDLPNRFTSTTYYLEYNDYAGTQQNSRDFYDTLTRISRQCIYDQNINNRNLCPWFADYPAISSTSTVRASSNARRINSFIDIFKRIFVCLDLRALY